MTQKSFRFDANRCTGCQACEIACTIENGLDPATSWRSVETFNAAHLPTAPVFHLSLACNHCVEPPCMEHCPALAYSKDPHTGAVTVDEAKCIGCKYCTWVCPYDAPKLDADRGVIHKCTFCDHRLAQHLEPACVTLCPTGALGFGDHELHAPEPTHLGFPRTGLAPAIRFSALRNPTGVLRSADDSPIRRTEDPAAADATERPAAPSARHAAASTLLPDVPSKIRLRSEWTLATFSLIAVFLFAYASLPSSRGPLLGIPGAAVVMLGLAGMAISTLHLGRKTRAWRAMLNWRRSWLSREVILYPTFLGLLSTWILTGAYCEVLRLTSVGLGLATLFTIDAVYRVTLPKRPWFHSGQALVSGVLLGTAAAGVPTVAIGVGALQATVYLARKLRFARDGRPVRPVLGAVRLGLGLAAPLFAWLAGAPDALVAAMLVVGVGIDRCEFYTELEIASPGRQMHLDLAAAATHA